MCTRVHFLQGGNEFPMGKPRLLSEKFLRRTLWKVFPKDTFTCFNLAFSLNRFANQDVLQGAKGIKPSIPWPSSPLHLPLQRLTPMLQSDQTIWSLMHFLLKSCASSPADLSACSTHSSVLFWQPLALQDSTQASPFRNLPRWPGYIRCPLAFMLLLS